jgi:hypothetical protein
MRLLRIHRPSVFLPRHCAAVLLGGVLLSGVPINRAEAQCVSGTEMAITGGVVGAAVAGIGELIKMLGISVDTMLAGGQAAMKTLQIVAEGKVSDKNSQDMHENARQKNQAEIVRQTIPARTCQGATGAIKLPAAEVYVRAVMKAQSKLLLGKIQNAAGSDSANGTVAAVAARARVASQKFDTTSNPNAPYPNHDVNATNILLTKVLLAPGEAAGTTGRASAEGCWAWVQNIIDPVPLNPQRGDSTISSAGLVAYRGRITSDARLMTAALPLLRICAMRMPASGVTPMKELIARLDPEYKNVNGASDYQMLMYLTKTRYEDADWHNKLNRGTPATLMSTASQVAAFASILTANTTDLINDQNAVLAALLALEVDNTRHEAPATIYADRAPPVSDHGQKYSFSGDPILQKVGANLPVSAASSVNR